ncbi:MAG: large conductance mechanosensitive channel protein MscL [Clostridia bacterium]|nr:large conductance mechanosensitive channel protein MscL [Clostridia bacterium]
MKKFLREFKEFAMRGNMLDLAVGVIIGGAFQKIVSSLVGDVISPFLGLFGGKDFSHLLWKIGEVEIKYGAFLTALIDFVIMAFIIFLLVKSINKLMTIGAKKKDEEPAAPTTKTCPYCKSEIAIDATRCPHCTSELN